MEERSNCFVLIAAIVLHESANAEEVGEDRDLALLPSVAAVKPHGIVERGLEAGGEEIRQGRNCTSRRQVVHGQYTAHPRRLRASLRCFDSGVHSLAWPQRLVRP